MYSLRILNSYKILDITGIETTSSFIRAKGDDFTRTKFAIVNGHTTTDFAIDGYSLLIYPPETVSTEDVKSLVVVAESEAVDGATLMRLGFGYDLRQVSGVNRLIQLFVFVLLKSPDSYILGGSTGGGVIDITKKGSGGQPQKVLPDVVAAIRKTEQDIRNMQAGLNLPSDELLLSANVISTNVNASDGSISVFVELITLDGTSRAFNIGI